MSNTAGSEPRRFRKRPVVIQAWQFDGTVKSAHAIYDWITRNNGAARVGGNPLTDWREAQFQIKTLESGWGWFTVDHSDFVIRGVKGEFYACKPDIFEATYEPAD